MQSEIMVKRWVFVLLAIAAIARLPLTSRGDDSASTLTPCQLHDPNNGPCLRVLWHNILIAGIRDVPGIKWISLEPYKVKKVRVAVDTPLVRLTMDLMKIEINGLTQSTIVDASATNGEIFQLQMNIPKMHIKGSYAMAGRILLLNLDGKGPFEMELNNIEIGLKMKATGVERDGEFYFEPVSLKTDVKHVGNIHVQFDNLFGSSQTLTDSANAVFNQNWSDLVELMRPVIAEAMDMSLIGQAKRYLGNLPARIAFSDIP